jgi:hypothetical protein
MPSVAELAVRRGASHSLDSNFLLELGRKERSEEGSGLDQNPYSLVFP